MQNMGYFENDFNPELSEYNPRLQELGKECEKEDEGFLACLIKKLTASVVVAEW